MGKSEKGCCKGRDKVGVKKEEKEHGKIIRKRKTKSEEEREEKKKGRWR